MRLPKGNTEWALLLERVFWIVGYLLVVTLILSIALEIREQVKSNIVFQTGELTGYEVTPKSPFSIWDSVQKHSQFVPVCLFSFFMSSVFGIVAHREAALSKKTDTLMLATCVAFLVEALMAFADGVLGGFQFLSAASQSSHWVSSVIFIFQIVLIQIVNLAPVLYAASIFVVYRHFSELAKFESETA